VLLGLPDSPNKPIRCGGLIGAYTHKLQAIFVVGKAALTLHPPQRPLSHNVNPRDGAQDMVRAALNTHFECCLVSLVRAPCVHLTHSDVSAGAMFELNKRKGAAAK
jgi:hypothetical protein